AQITVAETAALTALVQCIARLETREGFASDKLVRRREVLEENRFIAARDGMSGELIDPDEECRRGAKDLLEGLLEACRPHAQDLGCEAELEPIPSMARATGARRQLEMARGPTRLPGLVSRLADAFGDDGLVEIEQTPGDLRAGRT
ncbi:MAG: hypothetical protein ACR2J6_01780, partial [Thermoleophilaceae bacterium]